MLSDIPSTEVHDAQEYESLTYDSLLLRCADAVMRTGVANLFLQLYAIIDRLKKEAVENQRRVADLENDEREVLASKEATEKLMGSNEQWMSGDGSGGIIDARQKRITLSTCRRAIPHVAPQ
jgi:hypothetical protein